MPSLTRNIPSSTRNNSETYYPTTEDTQYFDFPSEARTFFLNRDEIIEPYRMANGNAGWGTRVPTEDDRNLEAQYTVSAIAAWNYMICDIKLFDYQEPKRCELNGCTQLMTVYHREDRDQLYYQCDGNFQGDTQVPNGGHFDVVKRSVTLHSFWYNRKAKANRILNTVMEYIRGNSIGKINKSIRISPDAAR
ncbi:hypothetical protein INT47_003113 [Mucor saturninus]|uniref:Uncharacterized protein n=1 Tax=Mucor saturninus TaxID=64648 RepID=A0A8H7QIR8_9FUNG|nr:hypothetical protein INT47_003113 [Mucor saturninus]